LKIIEVIH